MKIICPACERELTIENYEGAEEFCLCKMMAVVKIDWFDMDDRPHEGQEVIT